MTRTLVVKDVETGTRFIAPTHAVYAVSPERDRVCVDVGAGPRWYALEGEQDVMQALGWYDEKSQPPAPPHPATVAILDVISQQSGDGFWLAGCEPSFWIAVHMWIDAGSPDASR